MADLKAYLSQYDQGFGVGQYNGSENGTRKIGAEGVYHANPRTDIQGLAYHEDNLATDAARDVVQAEAQYRSASGSANRTGQLG